LQMERPGSSAGSVGPVVRCEPCDVGALVQCKPLPRDCAERVREPGCGCCLTCALVEGQACGVYTGRCGAGLTCQQRPGETKPLQALLDGRGVCLKKLSSALVPPQITGKRYTYNSHFQVRPVSVYFFLSPSFFIYTVQNLHALLVLFCSFAFVYLSEYYVTDLNERSEGTFGIASFPVYSTEINGPCRREIESVLKNLKISNVLNPRFFRIPNCDRKGFYKKKQCRPSKGRRRGYCWCVDKYGQPLPGYESKEQGQVHCYSMEKK
uniref:Insulin-like growth factor-binding protein 3 n=1 Tax=Electrophorus electricus TaxID=8005 RepID=A0AAY5EUS5_ELEEL